MKKIKLEEQLMTELMKLPDRERENLCIAMVAYLRFGLKNEIVRIVSHLN